MKRKGITVLLILIMLLLCCLTGCDEEVYQESEYRDEENSQGVQRLLGDFKISLNELAYLAPLTAHDYNLKTIDRQIELYILVEGKEPSGIGGPGKSGTLVGDGYLKDKPAIPTGLRQDTGEWSEYRIGGDPLRTWPVGDWEGAYRGRDK